MPCRSGQECLSGLRCSPEFMKAERGMNVAAGFARMQAANPETELETALPISLLQNNVDSHPQDLQAIVVLWIKLVQLIQRIAKHPDSSVPFRDTDFLFEGHW